MACCKEHEKYYKALYGLRVVPPNQCPMCQSEEDTEIATKALRSHVVGKWCKDHNHCSRCTEIKHYVRVLKHYGGTCSPKKCPVCEWERDHRQRCNVEYHKKRIPNIVKKLYMANLCPLDISWIIGI